MANVATLTVRLSANSAKLVKEFAKTQRRAKTFSQKMKGILAGVGRSFARIGAVAIPALVALGVAGIKSADKLAKTSAKLGIAANDLAALRFAAEESGVAVNTFDMALQRMTRRSAEAAKGTGEAKGAIAELGLEASEFGRLSPDEQFLALADAFEKVEDQGQRLRLGFKLFDSEGVAVVNTLSMGRKKLEEYRQEAERFGLVLTAPQLKSLEAAADAQNRLTKAFAGFSRQLGAGFAPAIKAAAEASARFVTKLTAGIDGLVASTYKLLGLQRELNGLSLDSLQREYAETQNEITELAKQLERAQAKVATKNIFSDPGEIAKATAFIQGYDAAYKKLADRLSANIEAQKNLAKSTDQVTESTSNYVAVAKIQTGQVAAVLAKFKQGSEELNKFIKAQDKLAASAARIFEATRTPVERYIANMKEAREVMEAGFLSEDAFERYRKQLLDGLVPAIEEVKEKSSELAMTFNSAFEDALVEGGKLREILQGIYKDILRILARKTIVEPISNILGGFFSGLIPGRAGGGAVMAGSPYVVGEQGAELFVPKQSGTIIPAGQFGGGGHSFVFTTTIHNKGDMDPETLVPILEQNNRLVKGEFLDELQRGKYD